MQNNTHVTKRLATNNEPIISLSYIISVGNAKPRIMAKEDIQEHSKFMSLLKAFFKVVALLTLLYFFICSIKFIEDGFKLLTGKNGGNNDALNSLLWDKIPIKLHSKVVQYFDNKLWSIMSIASIKSAVYKSHLHKYEVAPIILAIK